MDSVAALREWISFPRKISSSSDCWRTGLFDLEVAESIYAQGAQGFAFSTRVHVSGAKVGGTLLLHLPVVLLAMDGFLSLSQNGFDELHFGGRKECFGGAHSGGLLAPLGGLGEAVLKRANLHHGFVKALACLIFKQAAHAKQSFEWEAE